jgi:hypothetical protein
MKEKKTKHPEKRRQHRTQPSPRAKMERMLGRKLLKGEIPVVPPNQLPRCPVTPTHVKNFDQCCQDFTAGKLTEADVLAKVGESLKGLRKPAEQPKPAEG